MKVVHLSTTDTRGGAGRAAYRLHTGLTRAGIGSKMVVRRKTSEDDSVLVYDPVRESYGSQDSRRFQLNRITWNLRRIAHPQAVSTKIELKKLLRARPGGHDLFSNCEMPIIRSLPNFLPNSDVLNLHWVTGILDCATFFQHISPTKPIVWTLHDMNPFTGGCHYDEGCGRYREACGACPQLHSSSENDPSRSILKLKLKAFSQVDVERLSLVTPSAWLADMVRSSAALGRFPVHVIPNALDTTVFQPRSKSQARDVLGINPDAQVALIVADSLANRRKGMEYLVGALSQLSDLEHLTLLSVGRSLDAIVRDRIRLDESRLVHVGSVFDERLLSLIYSAADVFVLPSKQDNLPNTMLEAISCGVPVVGFDIGGIPDMVRPGVTGELVPFADEDGLAGAVRKVLTYDGYRNHLAETCRAMAVAELGLSVQAERYIALYESMLDRMSVVKDGSRAH